MLYNHRGYYDILPSDLEILDNFVNGRIIFMLVMTGIIANDYSSLTFNVSHDHFSSAKGILNQFQSILDTHQDKDREYPIFILKSYNENDITSKDFIEQMSREKAENLLKNLNIEVSCSVEKFLVKLK